MSDCICECGRHKLWNDSRGAWWCPMCPKKTQGNVHSLTGGDPAKNAATLKNDLENLLDDYGGAITNAEAIGCLALQMIDTYMLTREEDG